jgi:pyruvate dehydrogenase E1 component alpha subunit
VRIRQYLLTNGHWNKEQEEALLHDCSLAVEQAAADYLGTPPQPISANFDYVFAKAPAELIEQRTAALSRARGAA